MIFLLVININIF